METNQMEPKPSNNIFNEIRVINAGIEIFSSSLEEQKIPVIHVKWSPPTNNDDELNELLTFLL
jgi:hypothetical protein